MYLICKKRHDKTVIFVTHQLEALQYADRIVVLKNGAVATEGPTFQILNEIADGCWM
jgi:ABC-type proline/glycine betaine transport system ATPase subunit